MNDLELLFNATFAEFRRASFPCSQKQLIFMIFGPKAPGAHGTLMPIGIFKPMNDKQMNSFETLLLLSPNAKCWTNYLRRGSAISLYGPCGQFGCGSLFKTGVKHRKQSIFLNGSFVLNCLLSCLLNCLLDCLYNLLLDCYWIAWT